MTRLVCPECGRHSVMLKLKPRGEDVYQCIYAQRRRRYKPCDWYAFAEPDAGDTDGRVQLFRLGTLNPSADI